MDFCKLCLLDQQAINFIVGFRANREWEFIVGDQRLYCMKSNDIIIEYEYQGNEKEYNPSWARSC